MDKKITILSVNYNSADFMIFNLYALKKLTKNPYQVYIIDNNSLIEDYNKLKNAVNKLNDVYLERNSTNLKGEEAHGSALNYLCQKVDTPYFVILDPDAVWLKLSWDEILINQLDSQIKIIGTQAKGSNKYEDFPILYAVLFDTKTFKKLDVDLRPKENIGVGYGLRNIYLNANYQGEVIEMMNTRHYKKGPFKDIVCAEFYLNQDYNKIFACHFSRGSTGGANKYQKGRIKYFYKLPVLGKYFLKKKGEKEKKEWFQIATSIIKKEAIN